MDKKVREIIADYLGLKVSEVQLEMDLVDDLRINSYDIMSIIGRFEQAFNIEVPDRDIRYFKTVNDITEYIEKKK